MHGILKRKLSLGNASPDQSIAGAISSILKKSGASSSGQVRTIFKFLDENFFLHFSRQGSDNIALSEF